MGGEPRRKQVGRGQTPQRPAGHCTPHHLACWGAATLLTLPPTAHPHPFLFLKEVFVNKGESWLLSDYSSVDCSPACVHLPATTEPPSLWEGPSDRRAVQQPPRLSLGSLGSGLRLKRCLSQNAIHVEPSLVGPGEAGLFTPSA